MNERIYGALVQFGCYARASQTLPFISMLIAAKLYKSIIDLPFISVLIVAKLY